MATKSDLLKRQDAKVVGSRIDKVCDALDTQATELHAVAVQCMLHIRDTGSNGLMERFLDRLAVNEAGEKRGAAIVNVKGLRFWMSQACPMVERNGVLSLLKKESDGYAKWLERNVKLGAAPDDITLGGRAFFIDYWSEHPFWANAEVERDQRANITPVTVKRLIGNVFAIERGFKKAVEEHRFVDDTIPIATEFLAGLKAYVDEFTKTHAYDIQREEQLANEKRESLANADHEATVKTTAEAPIPDEVKPPEAGGLATDGMGEAAENPNKAVG